MYFSHTFAHRETCSRARSWLQQLGFQAREGATTSGAPRLVIVDEPHRLAAAKMLINAAENADPDGFKPFWDKAPQLFGLPKECREDLAGSGWRERDPNLIGWHPLD